MTGGHEPSKSARHIDNGGMRPAAIWYAALFRATGRAIPHFSALFLFTYLET